MGPRASRFRPTVRATSGPHRPARRASSSALGKSRRTWSRSCSTPPRCASRPAIGGSRPSGRRRSWRRWRQTARPAARGSASCSSSRANSTRWNWPTEERGDRPSLEARKADRLDGVAGIVDVEVPGAAEAAEAATSARAARCRRRKSGRRDRSRPAAAGRRCAVRALDPALDTGRQAKQRLQEAALAGAVGTDDSGHLARRDLRRQMMHGRMAS